MANSTDFSRPKLFHHLSCRPYYRTRTIFRCHLPLFGSHYSNLRPRSKLAGTEDHHRPFLLLRPGLTNSPGSWWRARLSCHYQAPRTDRGKHYDRWSINSSRVNIHILRCVRPTRIGMKSQSAPRQRQYLFLAKKRNLPFLPFFSRYCYNLHPHPLLLPCRRTAGRVQWTSGQRPGSVHDPRWRNDHHRRISTDSQPSWSGIGKNVARWEFRPLWWLEKVWRGLW